MKIRNSYSFNSGRFRSGQVWYVEVWLGGVRSPIREILSEKNKNGKNRI